MPEARAGLQGRDSSKDELKPKRPQPIIEGLSASSVLGLKSQLLKYVLGLTLWHPFQTGPGLHFPEYQSAICCPTSPTNSPETPVIFGLNS
jgi:hypothetical protein